jgi:two-component system chemotaxis response regulator CheY
MASILIVDDEADCRRPLAALLKHEGYEITEARDGLEGLQRLNEKRHDLILLDMIMPGCDGITMLQAVRRRPEFAQLPVLLVTGYHEPELLTKARQIGVQEYIFKGDTPFSKMLELIKRHLGERYTPKRRGRKPKIPRPEFVPPPPGGASVKPQNLSPTAARFRQLQLELLDNDDY